MFLYSDPTGGTLLEDHDAIVTYRDIVDFMYRRFGAMKRSGFTELEAFDGVEASATTIDWPAFPISVAAPNDDAIDNKRFDFQDEYVEWRVEKKEGKVVRVTFTTEFPEYYQALAAVSLDALIAGVREAIPGADPTAEHLFGPGFDPHIESPRGRSERFRKFIKDNPWNNGRLGILCLAQQNNTMGALFQILADCGIPDLTIPANAKCSLVGCAPDRASDPRICTSAQNSARSNEALTLADPPGVRILRLAGVWRRNDEPIDINNSDVWLVSRDAHHAVLNTDGLTLDGALIETGAQVSRALRVGATVLTAPEDRLPNWARMGNEGTRGVS